MAEEPIRSFPVGARWRVRHVAGDGPVGRTTGRAFRNAGGPLMIQVQWPRSGASWVPARRLVRVETTTEVT